MWIITGILSLLMTVLSLGCSFKGKRQTIYSVILSFIFTGITLLLQYHMVYKWVLKEDWSALLDVVPLTFYILCGYVTVIIVLNSLSLLINKRSS